MRQKLIALFGQYRQRMEFDAFLVQLAEDGERRVGVVPVDLVELVARLQDVARVDLG